MITQEERVTAIKNAPPQLIEVYGSEEVTGIIKKIRTTHGIKDGTIVDLIGDTILGVYTPHELPQLLTEELHLSWKIAGDVMSELGHIFDLVTNAQSTTLSAQGAEEASEEIPPTSPAQTPAKSTEPSKPLTRDELMKALATRQSEKGGLEEMRRKLAEAAEPKIGYGNPQEEKE